jgi:hypothetical protein
VLTALLVFAIVFETLIAVWSFTHFGAGASSLAVKRFPEWGAEGLVAIAASTAACAWFTLQWRRWAAWGLLGGLSLQVFWYYLRRPLTLTGFPSNLFPSCSSSTVGLALGVAATIGRIWNDLSSAADRARATGRSRS